MECFLTVKKIFFGDDGGSTDVILDVEIVSLSSLNYYWNHSGSGVSYSIHWLL